MILDKIRTPDVIKKDIKFKSKISFEKSGIPFLTTAKKKKAKINKIIAEMIPVEGHKNLLEMKKLMQ